MSKKTEDLPFEEALGQLENIVNKMETGELPLDSMVEHFEEGSRLAKHCNLKLKNFEKKIEILTRENESGGEWRDFDPASGGRGTVFSQNDNAGEEEDSHREDSLF